MLTAMAPTQTAEQGVVLSFAGPEDEDLDDDDWDDLEDEDLDEEDLDDEEIEDWGDDESEED